MYNALNIPCLNREPQVLYIFRFTCPKQEMQPTDLHPSRSLHIKKTVHQSSDKFSSLCFRNQLKEWSNELNKPTKLWKPRKNKNRKRLKKKKWTTLQQWKKKSKDKQTFGFGCLWKQRSKIKDSLLFHFQTFFILNWNISLHLKDKKAGENFSNWHKTSHGMLSVNRKIFHSFYQKTPQTNHPQVAKYSQYVMCMLTYRRK